MAYDDQKEPALPVNGKSNRKSADLLPRYFRTTSNTKFLSATLDQVLKPGTAKKLKSLKANYKKKFSDEIFQTTAKKLSEGKIVGWFQGRMEFGPRALGARSILADPRSEKMQKD